MFSERWRIALALSVSARAMHISMLEHVPPSACLLRPIPISFPGFRDELFRCLFSVNIRRTPFCCFDWWLCTEKWWASSIALPNHFPVTFPILANRINDWCLHLECRFERKLSASHSENRVWCASGVNTIVLNYVMGFQRSNHSLDVYICDVYAFVYWLNSNN